MRRIALVPYTRGWSYDFTAQALKRHLGERFEIRIFYRDMLNELREGAFDLVVDFWWRGELHRRLPRRVAKQVSSHRWSHPKWGRYDARGLAGTHLRSNVALFVPSKRLVDELAPVARQTVDLCPKGFHPDAFGDAGERRGDLSIGWAGNASAADKNLPLISQACAGLRVAGGSLSQEEMPGFYNGVDVITCASDADGDPRPLIEGMACGCFPVTVNVGIAPELVQHGDNGLIVDRTERAFAEAFDWCRANLERVREAGRRNAETMLASRTWAHASTSWAAAFGRAIAASQ